MQVGINPLDSIDIGMGIAESMEIYRKKCYEKWKPLIEAHNDQVPEVPANMKSNLAVIMENQAIHSNKYIKAGKNVLEQTTLSDVTLPTKFALPIIRQVYPLLWSSKVAAIQPMAPFSGGVAQLFYLDFLYEDTEGEPSTTSNDSDYALSEENAVPNRLKLTITSDTVTATKDILAAVWSSEVMEDVMGTLGLNVHQELITHAVQEIVREMDNRVLNAMLGCASAGSVTWDPTVPDTGYTAKEWYETLAHAFVDAEALIRSARYRKADWIVAGPNVIKYVRKMQDFTPFPNNDPFGQPAVQAVEVVGRLTGQWDIYTSDFIDSDTALMGCYPRSQMDTGFILCPYIPIEAMPLIYADMAGTTGIYSNKDKWTRNVRTRYAYKCVVGDLFSTITISAS